MSENNERRRREKRPITLEDVEKHLTRQDEAVKWGNCFTMLTIGFSIMLVGLAIWIGNLVSGRIGIALLGNCSLLWLGGLGVVFWAFLRTRKIKE